jgi:hypothetical protein
MKRRQVFRAQASKSQSSSSVRRFANSGPVLPFNPASIPGCQLWLDAADTSSVLADSSSNVSLWIDKSNTGTTATPTRGPSGNQITYVTVDTYRGIYINNNGSAGYNSSTYSQLTIQSNFQNTADYSIFAVVNLSNVPAGEYQTIYGNARGTSGETRTPNFGAGMSLEFNADTTNRMISSSFIGSGRLQTALISSSSALTAYTNTTAYGSVTNGFTRVSTDVGALPSIGGPGSFNDNRFATGYFHEILIYNTALSTIQRQKVEGYLAHKWGLQSSLPTNHLHKTAAPTYEEPVFVPTLISGNQLWLDGADSSTITGTTSVTAWRDKSTNAYVANSFVNSVANPSSVSNIQNGNGVIRYTAGNGSSIANFVLAQTMSIFMLYYPINQSTNGPFLEHSPDANTNSGLYFHANGGDNFLINAGTTGYPFPSVNFGNTTVSNTWQLIQGINPDTVNSNKIAFYVNGTTRASGATQSAAITVTKTLYINGRGGTGNLSYNTYLAELIIYNTALTPSQRQRVEGYLAQKWGLQSSLPANHPFKTIAPTGIPRSITIQSLSALFSNSSLTIPANAALTLGTNSHTIEFWMYQTSRGQYDNAFSYGNITTAFMPNTYYFSVGDYLGFVIGNGAGNWAININAGTPTSLNVWNHYAIVRNGTTFTLYVNGINRGSQTSSINITAQGDVFRIGALNSGGTFPINGYITNFRLVNGTAVYTSNFTPPTSPLTAIPNTQILLQGLVDRSPNAFTVTNNGGVALSTSVSPFV